MKVERIKLKLLFLPVMLLIMACTGSKTHEPSASDKVDTLVATPAFNGDSAFAFVVAQCDFGPRVPGSTAHDACAEWIKQQFASFGMLVTEHQATVRGYDGAQMLCRNIISRMNHDASSRILITAHWDSRAWADNDPDPDNHHSPVMAANDGASGVAVMLEMARVMATMPPATGVDFVCFDVEDQGRPQWADAGDDDDNADFWCLGSRAWAESAYAEGYTARFAINLDMVGGRDARFAREGYSLRQAASVVELIWTTASRLGHSMLFTSSTGGYVMDDHVSVSQLAGIPAADIIPNVDYQRSSFGRTWHTIDDTPENIDPRVMAAVGETLLQIIYR